MRPLHMIRAGTTAAAPSDGQRLQLPQNDATTKHDEYPEACQHAGSANESPDEADGRVNRVVSEHFAGSKPAINPGQCRLIVM